MLNAVIGPSDGLSTDNAVVRWDGATGRLVQNSGVIITDNNRLELPANASGGLAFYNAANADRVLLSAATNIFSLYTEANGGSQRAFRIGSSAGYIETGVSSGTYTFGGAALLRLFTAQTTNASFQFAANVSTSTAVAAHDFASFIAASASSGIQTFFQIAQTFNQSGTAGYKAFRVAVTETATGSGQKDLASFEVGGNQRNRIGQNGNVYASMQTAIPAGGAANTGYFFSSTAGFGTYYGSGAPTVSAAKGSLYLRSDGSGTNDRAYINTDGGTTWTAIVTVA